MAVKRRTEDGKLILEFDNGDVSRFDQAMQKWKFKDDQSFLRFAVSLFLVNEGSSFSIQQNGQQAEFVPPKDLLKPAE